MIIVRFKVNCKPAMAEQVRAAMQAVIKSSRKVEGVLSFDIARDLTDSNSFIATEVFADRAALDRQEALPEVKKIMALLPDALAAEPEAIIYNVSSAKPWGD